MDKNNNGKDISGSYDENGKIRLGAVLTAVPKSSNIFGNPVALTTKDIARVGFGDTPTLSGKLSFLCDGAPIGDLISIANGAASSDWTPFERQDIS